jgi:hypothetical protein
VAKKDTSSTGAAKRTKKDVPRAKLPAIPEGELNRPLPPMTDAELVTHAALNGGKDRDICGLLGISKMTLNRKYGTTLTKLRSQRRLNIRTWQTRAAEAGNPALLIWLGKQDLDQSEPFEIRRPNLNDLSDEELREIADGTAKLVRRGS